MKTKSKNNLDWLVKEHDLWTKGLLNIAGIDEAGRGPLAGPVVAAAVILKPWMDLPGVIDSKQMSEGKREEAYDYIMKNSLCVAIAASSVKVIDRINILKATMVAMNRSVFRLKQTVDYLLIDGNRFPDGLEIPGETVIGGDGICRSIAAASVIAKVTRDRLMRKLDRIYPNYGFAENKGYGTAEHIRSIEKYGPTPHHRYSFAPVRQVAFSLESD
ncbi:MAG: ribonuclease HII [Candidatus Hatepunaea meridiana]|nr:ribonuclease HII [Candidatus Hatepunaea meridiana]